MKSSAGRDAVDMTLRQERSLDNADALTTFPQPTTTDSSSLLEEASKTNRPKRPEDQAPNEFPYVLLHLHLSPILRRRVRKSLSAMPVYLTMKCVGAWCDQSLGTTRTDHCAKRDEERVQKDAVTLCQLRDPKIRSGDWCVEMARPGQEHQETHKGGPSPPRRGRPTVVMLGSLL